MFWLRNTKIIVWYAPLTKVLYLVFFFFFLLLTAIAFSDVSVYVGITLRRMELCAYLKGPVSPQETVAIECLNATEANFVKIVTDKGPRIPLSKLTVCGIEVYGENSTGISICV